MTLKFLNLEAAVLHKLLEYYWKLREPLENLSINLEQARRRKFLMLKLQTGMMNTTVSKQVSNNWM